MASNGGLADSWKTCFKLLPEVSRTFALAIAGLKEPLRGRVAVSYLLCRILDTVEDAPGLTPAQRWSLIEPVLERLAKDAPAPAGWGPAVEDLLATRSAPSDLELMRHADDVLACFGAGDESSRLAMARWVTEMGKGMVEFSERMGGGRDSLKTLPTMASLDRYCYYIAGTVGYLLTDLFAIHAPQIDRPLSFRLQADAEAFGLGLQKVNIVKDLADDFRRGWCFVPLDDLRGAGLEPRDLLDASKAEPVLRAVTPVLRSARAHLECAWRYLTRIPVEEREIRLFLAYSLFFALGTLALVAEEPARLVRPEKLKITRVDVASLVARLQVAVGDPSALEAFHRKASAPLAAF